MRILFDKCNKCLVGRVYITLGNNLIGGVHRDYRNTQIYCFNIMVCNILGNCSAAARINLTKLCGLPNYTVFSKELSYEANELSRGIACARLASRACILAKACTAGEDSAVSLLIYIREIRVKGCINIGAETL